MDILWLQNSVSRQFLVNAVATISEQLITINNVVNDLVSGNDATITNSDSATNTPINRSNETLFTKKLINSIRGSVACTHRHGFSGDTDNYLYQQTNSAESKSHLEPQSSAHYQQQSLLQRHQSSNSTTARTIKNIKAIGNIVNLDIEKSGTISTYDCDSNYTTNATETITFHSNYGSVNNFWSEHNVKNDKCNYNNYNDNKKNKHNRNTSTTSASTLSSGSGTNHNDCHLNRLNIDSAMKIAPISANTRFNVHFDQHAQISRNQWWKNLVIVICYLFLLSSSLRICSANKHEGNFSLFILCQIFFYFFFNFYTRS